MTRTFTFTFEHRSLVESSFPRRENTFVISAEPITTENPDRSTTISVGFPILALSGWVGEPERFAELVARLLTEHYAKGKP